jgi:D-glycerate 3-kinase
MHLNDQGYKKVKKKYLKFLKSQEIQSEPFRDKLGQLNNFFLPMCEKIYKNFINGKKTKVIGLTGGQGSGKSTISNILKIILKEGFKLNTVTFSIDDFYKTLKERKKMSVKISPLFLTRGVPGTHDTNLLFKCLRIMKRSKFKKILIPKFDKSIDDRMEKNKWQKIKKKPDIVIFEGWCVGVTPQKNKDLLAPINALEKEKDKKKVWRRRVNKELGSNYKKIFNEIDLTIFLKVPSFKHVFQWRLLQEKKLIATSKGKKTMNKKQIKNFIMYYERLTKHMLKNLSKKTYCVIDIDQKHRLKSIKFN